MEKNSESHKEMRVGTLLKVMKAIQDNAQNKNDIRDKTGLSWGSCSETISLLTNEKIITPCKTETTDSSKPGRKASGFVFNQKKNLLVGIELKQNEIICSLIDFGNTELLNKSYPLDKVLSNKNIFKQISVAYNDFLIQAEVKPNAILGVSLSLTGGVDIKNKKWIFTPRMESISNVDFNELMDILPEIQYLNIEHDINAQASSVISHNNWKKENYAFLHFGEGVGMSFFNNELYTGHRGFAGEIGHVPYHPFNGKIKCQCGRTNCFEALLSSQGIIKLIGKFSKKHIRDLSQINDSIINNKELTDFLTNAVSYIITMLSNILDPEAVIIGGEALEPFLSKIQNNIDKKVKKDSWLGGTKELKWYKADDINCAYGTIVNSGNKIMEQYIIDNLI